MYIAWSCDLPRMVKWKVYVVCMVYDELASPVYIVITNNKDALQ